LRGAEASTQKNPAAHGVTPFVVLPGQEMPLAHGVGTPDVLARAQYAPAGQKMGTAVALGQ
jgi:hypothetical protein